MTSGSDVWWFVLLVRVLTKPEAGVPGFLPERPPGHRKTDQQPTTEATDVASADSADLGPVEATRPTAGPGRCLHCLRAFRLVKNGEKRQGDSL